MVPFKKHHCVRNGLLLDTDYLEKKPRDCSSVGRALTLHSEGPGFYTSGRPSWQVFPFFSCYTSQVPALYLKLIPWLPASFLLSWPEPEMPKGHKLFQTKFRKEDIVFTQSMKLGVLTDNFIMFTNNSEIIRSFLWLFEDVLGYFRLFTK